MTEIPQWMFPRDWIDDPENVKVEITAEYEGRTDRQASYGNLEETLKHVGVVSRPAFLDKWERVIAVTNGYTPPKTAERDANADFNAAEAFEYCYRSVTRYGAVYLTHAVTPFEETNRGDSKRRPWSPRWDGDDPYQNPVQLFEEVLAEASMPPTPFVPVGSDNTYASLDALYADLLACDELALRDYDGNWFVTPRTAYIDPANETR